MSHAYWACAAGDSRLYPLAASVYRPKYIYILLTCHVLSMLLTTRIWLTVTVLIPFKIGQFKNQIEFRQKLVSHLTVLYSSTGLKSGEYGDRNTTPAFGTSAGFFLKGARMRCLLRLYFLAPSTTL